MNQKTNNPPSIRPIISLGNTAFESIRTGGKAAVTMCLWYLLRKKWIGKLLPRL